MASFEQPLPWDSESFDARFSAGSQDLRAGCQALRLDRAGAKHLVRRAKLGASFCLERTF